MVLNFLHSGNYKLTNESGLSSPSRLTPNLPSPDRPLPNRPPSDRPPPDQPPPDQPTPNTPPIWNEHGLQVHLQTRSMTAAKCITKLAQSRPWSASLSSLDLGLKLDLYSRSITASKFALTRTPTLLDYAVAMHLCIHLMSASKCISIVAWIWPPSTSLSSQVVQRWSSQCIWRELLRKSGSQGGA